MHSRGQQKRDSQKIQHDSSKSVVFRLIYNFSSIRVTMRTIVSLFLTLFLTSSAICLMEIEDVKIGFNNGYKHSKWTPLNVIVRSQNEPNPFVGELVVEVRDLFSDKPINRYATPLQLSKTDRKINRIYIYYPKNLIKLFIQLMPISESNKEIEPSFTQLNISQEITTSKPIKNKDYLILVLAPSGDKLQKLIDKKPLDQDIPQTTDTTYAHIRYLPNANAMPTRWISYSAVDLMLIREVTLIERRISKTQQTALLNWVQRGGTLIISGGNNFQSVQGSFIEQYLPVQLKHEKTLNEIPTILKQQFGINGEQQSLSDTENVKSRIQAFKNIHFEKKPKCQTILGTDEHIYIAKRNLGDGQIICFSFDYNAPPFSDTKAGETFWRWFLKTHGKSPRLYAEQYVPFRQHDEKIHQQFLSKMPTQIPLIKLLAIILPVYLLSFGGLLLYIERRGNSPKKRIRGYWIGGLIFVLVSVSAISVARTVLPKKLETDRFSIVSIYPEQKNAHLQSYTSIRTTSRTEASITLTQNTFMRPLLSESTTKPSQFFQGTPFQMRKISVEPWYPNTFVQQTFIPLDLQQTQINLENVWSITGDEATYLGTITLGSRDLQTTQSSSITINKIPPSDELTEMRKAFAQIIQREGLLQYLSKPDNLESGHNRTVLIGWTSELDRIKSANPITTDESVTTTNEALVIMYLDEGV